MLYTASYFDKNHYHGQLVSISHTVPKGIEVDAHLEFFKPSKELLTWWKSTSKDEVAWAEYTSQFWALLAERKAKILDWIHALERKPTHDSTMLCWEKAGHNCHRNLVARLLNKHKPELFGGCDVPQFQVNDKVKWIGAADYLSFLQPFEIRAIDGNQAYLHWISPPVPFAELKLFDAPRH